MNMNKWLNIGIIGVLVITTVLFAILYFGKSGELEDAQADISSLESNVSGLQSQVSTLNQEKTQLNETIDSLEGDLSDTQDTLSQTQNTLSQVQTDYDLLSEALAQANPYAAIFNDYYFVEVFTDEDFYAMDDAIGQLPDITVRTAWNSFIFNPTQENFDHFFVVLWDKVWETLYP